MLCLFMLSDCPQITFVMLEGFYLLSNFPLTHRAPPLPTPAHISLPIGINGKPLAAIGKSPSAIGKLMIGKTLATNGEEITCYDW